MYYKFVKVMLLKIKSHEMEVFYQCLFFFFFCSFFFVYFSSESIFLIQALSYLLNLCPLW